MITEGNKIRVRGDFSDHDLPDGVLPGDSGFAMADLGDGWWNCLFPESPYAYHQVHESDIEVVDEGVTA